MKPLLRFLPKKYRVRVAIKYNFNVIHDALNSQYGLSYVGTKAYIKRYTHALTMYKGDVKVQRLIKKILYMLWTYWDNNNFNDPMMSDYRSLFNDYVR